MFSKVKYSIYSELVFLGETQSKNSIDIVIKEVVESSIKSNRVLKYFIWNSIGRSVEFNKGEKVLLKNTLERELLDQKTKKQDLNLMNPISIAIITRCSILVI